MGLGKDIKPVRKVSKTPPRVPEMKKAVCDEFEERVKSNRIGKFK